MLPTKIFFTKGVGIHKKQLVSFDAALRDAGVASFNLVDVSSIFPPGADIVELSPIPGLIAPDFLAARLVYKIINCILK